MPQAEPQQHVKSDGTAGAMSIEIDLNTGATSEPVEVTPDVPAAPAAPVSLDLPAPAGTPERPAWLDPRFKSPEAMAEAYKALESKLGATPAPAAPAKAPETPAPLPTG